MHPQSASMRAEREQMNKSKCKTCKFYHRSKSLGGKSECRRNPPVLKITYCDFTGRASQDGYLPWTFENSWCGEFVPACKPPETK